jgi:endonuclease VIII
MEGPSLFLAAEQLAPFKKKVVLNVAGNTKAGKERMQTKKVADIFSWAKQLIFQFDNFALRIHFLLYGSFEATVNGRVVTGDYQRTYDPRLVLKFQNGEIKMFGCSVKFIESKKAKRLYDFSGDIMAPEWNEQAALDKVKKFPQMHIADVLMDQEIFGGVGNIIKNEVLFITRTNPRELVKNIPAKKLKLITREAREFSKRFYEWRKIFKLKANLQIYRKSICPICQGKVKREKTGERLRVSFYCPEDQVLTNN